MPMTAALKNRHWQAGLFAALLALTLVVSAGVLAARRETSLQIDLLKRVVEVHALALRGATTQYNYLPFTVAQHPKVLAALQTSDTASANLYLEEINRRAGSDVLYLMTAQGKTVASSNWNTPQSFVGQDYSNRPYFLDALAGRGGRFYGVGKNTGVPGYFISTPVRSGDRVVGVVVVKVDLRQVQQTWLNAGSPIALSDERGILFLGSVPEWMYTTSRELSPQEIAWLARHEVYGKNRVLAPLLWERESLDDGGQLLRTHLAGKERRFVAVSETLPDLGWTLTVTADYASVTQARNRAWALSAMAAGLLLLGGMLWQTRRRQFDELEKEVRLRTQDLNQAHAFRKAMEDSLLVGMRARDLEGHIIYVNPALTDITGYPAEELLGKQPPYPYWHPEDMERHWHDNEAALTGRSDMTGFESRVRHRDGHDVYTMVYTAPLIDADGKHSGWMSSVVDITAQKQSAARQREQEEKLRHVQRRAIMDEMASTLAHEINQPLLAIGANASAARKLLERGVMDQLQGCLQAIEQQKQRAADIVRKIQDHVRMKTRGAEDCDVNALVRSVLAFVAAEVRQRQTRVITRLQEPLPTVRGDRVLLEQVLVNLVINSLQAMQAQEAHTRVLELQTLSSSAGVLVQVSDSGPGIPADIADQIFKSFVTTKEEGLGIGLSICRTIVESHGGRLSFENRAQGGTTFTIQLPCTPNTNPI
ncbi:ATP-binding protein [Rhodoferax sp. GW822-FHT02A01]|uniref:ATP-binding protein n=1 Tax=Rhodoferax sp. GW822-FHT02A01 TaxID=3141537 RepID=UPI00315D6BB3